MVLFNLSKLILLIRAVKSCPEVIPKRNAHIFYQYSEFLKTSDDIVSVEVPAHLEKLKEIEVDYESDERKMQIIYYLIDTYTKSEFSFPEQPTDLYIVSPLDKCMRCSGDLILTRSAKKDGRAATLYTLKGPQQAKIYIKHCSQCLTAVHCCYYEWSHNGVLMRKYFEPKTCPYFSLTSESFFEVLLLEDLTESVFTCSVRFVRWVEKYNRCHNKKKDEELIERHKLVYQRVFPCWLIYSFAKRISVEFPVVRTSDRSIDIEVVCSILYPSLKNHIDKKWLRHSCKTCASRIVVLDGDQKLYRTRCASNGEKLIRKGQLNQFTACSASPINGKRFCINHEDDKEGENIERLDTGRMTRSKRRMLGLEWEELTTDDGCRKREAITVSSKRSKTAGMSYCFRACGISLGM